MKLENLLVNDRSQLRVKQSIILNVANNKNVRQCNPFRSSSRLSIRASFCICCAIYTIYSCFEQLLLCFSQFGGSWRFLNFDKFRDAVPLSCLITHAILLPRAMMMTACDLNGTTKPWEIQKEVCQASSLPGSAK